MAKLLLYGEIGWDVSSKEIVNWIDTHKGESIEMHVNSPGGDVFEAIAIRSAVLEHDDITIVVDAMAASAAAIISLCGKPLKMAEYSRLMIHSASTYASGNRKQMAESIERLQSIDADLAAMIAEKMGKTAEEVLAEYFDGTDHWFTADECVEMGIAEKCGEKTKDTMWQVFDCINGIHSNQKKTIQEIMDMTKFQTVAAFKDCTTEEEVIEKANEQSAELDAKNAEIAEKDAKIADLEAKVAEFENEKKKAQEDADESAISDALAQGKLNEDQAEIYRNLMKSDRENAHKMLASLKAPEEPAKVADFTKGEGSNQVKKSYFAETLERIAERK